MINFAPDHIKEYCYCDYSDQLFRELFDEFDDAYTAIYKIKCSCGCSRFKVYVDPNPTVEVVCIHCEKRICVYDLINYPAAVKCPHDNDTFTMVDLNLQSEFEVYAIYEYSDDYDSENDITWCHVFAGMEKDLVEIIDDETA